MGQTRVQTKTGIAQPGEPVRHRLVNEYDFTVDGGAIGTIPMRGDSLPLGAFVLDQVLLTDTVLTSGGAATVALTIESANDVVAAAAYSGTPYSTTGMKRTLMTATAAPVKTTADRQPSVVVAAANLTAGRFRLVTDYYLMDA